MPGYREGDLILGLDRSVIGTLVERTMGATMLRHLPRTPGHGDGPRERDGPRSPDAVREAIARQTMSLPERLRRLLTWD